MALNKSRKNYHHGDLKSALIAAGLDELEEKGLESVSLRSIAARVGVSHTAPKNHFDGLRGLLTAIASVGFERHAAEMQRGMERESSRKARLDAACNGYVRFGVNNPELFKLMFSSTLCDVSDPALKSASSASYEVLRGIAHELDWDKAKLQNGPKRTEWMLWSMVHGYTMLLIERQITRADDGSLQFEVVDIIPAFEYQTE